MKLTVYIKGERRGSEANRIERKAMRDPFLYDAIDGYDVIEGEHTERIADMRRRLSRKSRRVNHWMAYAGIAASLLVCVIAGSYFIFNKNSGDFVAKNETPANEVAFEEQLVTKKQISEEVRRQYDREEMIQDDKQSLLDFSHEDIAENKNQLAQKEKVSGQENAKVLNDAVVTGYGSVKSATERKKVKTARLETPEPKTGWKAYRKYLKDALRRPSDNECFRAKGTVEVTFHIDKEGTPYDLVIGKSLCPSADAEAIRLVKEGGLWTCESYKRMKVKIKF
jgi:hypothetical protein